MMKPDALGLVATTFVVKSNLKSETGCWMAIEQFFLYTFLPNVLVSESS